MITAIDTNVLLDILVGDARFFNLSARALQTAAAEGSLVICDLVYAELCLHFKNQRACDDFLDDNEIRIEALSRSAGCLAGSVWRDYRRRGGRRTRVLADFLIAAHAQLQASRLLSRDRGFYRSLFPTLVLIDPSREARG